MDGLSRAVGAGPTVTLCGQTFNVKGRILRFYGEIEAEIIKQRGNPFDYLTHIRDVFSGTNEDGSEDLMRIAIQEGFREAKTWRHVSGKEIHDWISNTIRGYCFMIWLCIRHNDETELTLEKVTDLYLKDREEVAHRLGEEGQDEKDKEISSAIDQASGDDDLGNSTGPGNRAKPEAVPQV